MTDRDTLWTAWAARWKRFQEAYVPYREAQLAVMSEYVAVALSASAIRVLDLCSGPGAVGERLLEVRPEADIVAVDLDPWLLEVGRRTSPAARRVVWVDADVRRSDWVEALPCREFHAVVTAAAMHWFEPHEIQRIYREVATLLLPAGLFLMSDTAPFGTPRVQWLARAALSRWRNRETARLDTDDWPSFWREARSVPEFRDLLAERDRRFGRPRPFLSNPLSFHESALVRAGFTEVGEVWRCHETAMLLATR